MWTCHKCGKPVYFAERRSSIGLDWHPECLRCEECGKRLNPGQHAEHKGIPYCNVPCYSALFGPTLFGHGSQVESHKSFGKMDRVAPPVDREKLEAKVKHYNHYYDGKSGVLNFKERNGKLILEGVLRIFWGVRKVIRLQEDDEAVNKRTSCQEFTYERKQEPEQEPDDEENDENVNEGTLERNNRYQTLPSRMPRQKQPANTESSANENKNSESNNQSDDYATYELSNSEDEDNTGETKSRKSIDLSRVQIRKLASSRSRTKLRRRCSINGHYYNRETSVFRPPLGSATNVWVTSLVTAPEVINLLLEKFRVENDPQDFALYIVLDNGETKRIKDHEYPLLIRVILGPHEDVAKVFIMDKSQTNEISSQVAQYINLQEPELKAILKKFNEEEEREIKRLRYKYIEMRRLIRGRLLSLTSQN